MDNTSTDPVTRLSRDPIQRISNAFENQPFRWSMLFILPFLALLLVKAVRMPMWLDEFYTFWIAQQPTISSAISAVREGCDAAPPLYAILVKFSQQAFGETALALRLPSFLGFCLMLACAFAFLQRRLGALYAAMGVLVTASSTYAFATEGRPYGLALGCIALALLCWQAACEGGRRSLALVGLLLSMAVAISLHYYVVFVLLPLGLAELSRQYLRRKIDLPTIVALLFSPLVLLVHRGLIEAGRVFLEHFWQKGSLADIPGFYRSFLSDATLWVPVAMVLLAAYLMVPGTNDTPEQYAAPGFRVHEWLATLLLALLPAIGIPIARLVIGVARGEYFFPALLGMGMIISGILFRTLRGRTLVPLAFVVALAVWLGSHALYQAAAAGRLRNASALQQLLVGIPPDPAPIFVPSLHAFVELWHYGDPGIRHRVISAVSLKLELLPEHDNLARIWLAITRRVSVPVLPFDLFLRSTPRFLLADDPDNEWSWFFVRSGYQVKPLDRPRIYLVQRRENPQHIETLRRIDH